LRDSSRKTARSLATIRRSRYRTEDQKKVLDILERREERRDKLLERQKKQEED